MACIVLVSEEDYVADLRSHVAVACKRRVRMHDESQTVFVKQRERQLKLFVALHMFKNPAKLCNFTSCVQVWRHLHG
jgi:hypothetical protein